MSEPAAVVVGYDGSPDAKRALAWAAAFAGATSAPVRVVVAVGDLRLHRLTHHETESRTVHEAALAADARAAVKAVGLEHASVDVVNQVPAAALLDAADESTVVVVGSRGHGRWSGTLSGSVSQHVGRHAPCPVVVVREQSDPDASRVVVATDGSPGCQPALEFGFEHARLTGAELLAVYVLEDLDGRYGTPAPQARGRTEDLELGLAEPVLSHALRGFPERYPDVRLREDLLIGSAVRNLADASEHAALLVVGSRGHGGFEGLLLGSVGQGLLQHARCPLVIAR
jgi:nucleotide-binding universal stress UspA family protein